MVKLDAPKRPPGRPPSLDKLVPVMIAVQRNVLKRIDRAAKKEFESRPEMIRRYIAAGLKRAGF